MKRHDKRTREQRKADEAMLFAGVCLLLTAVLIVAAPLVAVVWSVVTKGSATAFADFPAFFTSDIPLVSRKKLRWLQRAPMCKKSWSAWRHTPSSCARC